MYPGTQIPWIGTQIPWTLQLKDTLHLEYVKIRNLELATWQISDLAQRYDLNLIPGTCRILQSTQKIQKISVGFPVDTYYKETVTMQFT